MNHYSHNIPITYIPYIIIFHAQALLSALHALEARQSDLRDSALCHVAVSLYEPSQEPIAGISCNTPSVNANNRLQADGGVDLDPTPPKWSGGGVDLEISIFLV